MDDSQRRLSSYDLFGRIFTLYRHHFKLFVAVSIVGPAVILIYRIYRLLRLGLTIAVTQDDLQSSTIAMAIQIVIAFVFMLLVGLSLSSVATIRAVAAVSSGRPINASEAYRAFRFHPWRIVGILLAIFLRAFLAAALFILLGMFALGLAAALGYNSRVEAGTIGVACGSIALAAAIFVASAIYVRYALAIQVCVEEDLSRKLALKRSVFLTGTGRVRVVMLYALFTLLFFAVGFVVEAPTLLLRHHAIVFRFVGAFSSLIAATLTTPVWTIGISLFYFDQQRLSHTSPPLD